MFPEADPIFLTNPSIYPKNPVLGEEISISGCVFDGSHKIFWYKDGELLRSALYRLPSGRSYGSTAWEFDYLVRNQTSSLDDQGYYQCAIRNLHTNETVFSEKLTVMFKGESV